MTKSRKTTLIALVWVAAAAWCWAITAYPAVSAWMGQEAWPLGALTGFMIGRRAPARIWPDFRRKTARWWAVMGIVTALVFSQMAIGCAFTHQWRDLLILAAAWPFGVAIGDVVWHSFTPTRPDEPAA